MNIDIEKLRHDLIDYFGSASCMFSLAVMDVTYVENASYNKLIEIARSNGFNLNNYVIKPYTRNLFK